MAIDRQDPIWKTLDSHLCAWDKKSSLQYLYTKWFKQIKDNMSPGKTLDIGCGIGKIKDIIPDMTSLDIVHTHWCDVVADALQLPFKNDSLGNIILFDSLHHLPSPLSFFEEAEKSLKEDGRIIIVDPYVSPFSYFIYKNFHHETTDMRRDPYNDSLSSSDNPFDSNQAISTLLFYNNESLWNKKFPNLKIISKERFAFFAYPATGGFSDKKFLPDSLVVAMDKVENIFRPLASLLAFRTMVVLSKQTNKLNSCTFSENGRFERMSARDANASRQRQQTRQPPRTTSMPSTSNMDSRLHNEQRHALKILEAKETYWGWSTPAGKIRRQRRVNLLCSAKALLEKSPITPSSGARVLEIGCGTGTFTAALAEAYPGLCSIDLSQELLRLAKQRSGNASFCQMDIHEFAFADNTFDGILGCSVLHHLDIRKGLASMHRVLKPGGFIVFSEPNLLNPQIFLQKNIPFLKRWAGDSPNEYAFTPRGIQRELEQAGFSTIRVRPYEFLHPHTPEGLIQSVMRCESFLEKSFLRPFCGSLAIEAKK